MDTNKICSLIDKKQEELFSLLSSLIKINSESLGSFGNEAECADYIQKLCIDLGLESEKYSPLDIENFKNHSDYLEGRNLENRYNVTSRFKGSENTDSLMLMAHIDTVGIGDRSNWKGEPLSGEIRDGKIFGRGACDDKYAIAAVLFIMRLLREEDFIPSKNLIFSAYCDEEYGGSHGALASVLKYPCEHIVSLDGREKQIWHCASGGGEIRYRWHVKNPVSSAEITASVIPTVLDVIDDFAKNRRTELENNRFYNGTVIPETSLRILEVKAGNNGMDMDRGEVLFVYYTDKTREEIEKELLTLNEAMRERLSPLGIVSDGFEPNTRFFHYAFCEPDSDDIKIMLEASREATGKELLVCGSCLSDLSVISKFGSSRAFAFGAGREFNAEGGAHQPNEFIECRSLVDYTKTIAAFILKILG